MGSVETEADSIPSGMVMNGSSLLPLFCILLVPALALAVAGEGEGEAAPRRSLDLSLPRDAQSETWNPPPARSTAPLPDLGSPRKGNAGHPPRGAGSRTDLPYGAGYEARQAGGGGAWQGQGRGRGRGR